MQIEKIKFDIEYLEKLYAKLIRILPSFDITDSNVLPYGLKPHTRSISWLVEQVINQQMKFHKDKLCLSSVDFDMPDTCLHDCIIQIGNKKYFVNIKAHNADARKNRNDIAAVEKIFMQYSSNSDYDILYVCLGIHFKGINISFDKDYIKVFSAQFLPIYINPRNDKIQAFYEHEPEYRTRKQFLKELQSKSRSIVLGKR
jgi:hypothetical protein